MQEFALRRRALPPFERLALGGLFALAALALALLGGLHPLLTQWRELMEYGEAGDWTSVLGRACGGMALGLLLVQAFLGSRSKWLDRVLGLDRVYWLHRRVALAIVVLAAMHPLLVFFHRPLDLAPAWRSWPVLLGAMLLVSLWLTACMAHYRRFIELPYRLWQIGHRLGTWPLILLACLHPLFASPHFGAGAVTAALLAMGAVAALALRARLLKKFGFGKVQYTLRAMNLAGPDALELTLVPADAGKRVDFFPGQFAFLTPETSRIPAEEHPFTIASAPDEAPLLRFTIRQCGDFTSLLPRLIPGDRVLVDGPYGRFGYAALTGQNTPLLMVAGGVGVTPMLSMLRALARERDPRPICLVWSIRDRQDLLHPREWEELESRLPGFSLMPVYSRQKMSLSVNDRLGRVRASILKDALARVPKSHDSPAPHAFVCGPPAMMASVRADLLALGMDRGRVHLEEFAL